MIVCPSCQHQEIDGSLFCSECGALLLGAGKPTSSIDTKTDGFNAPAPDKPLNPPAGARLALQIVDTEIVIPLSGKNEYTLGRLADGQPMPPDVDFTSYQGYDKGISRMHATLYFDGLNATLTDAGSVNGTRVNGNKIIPLEPVPVKNGDTIALGKLKFLILIQR